VGMELDVQAGSGDEFAWTAMQWLDTGSRRWLGPAREALDRDPDPPWQPAGPAIPTGPPGSVWGQVAVTKLTPNTARVRRIPKPATAKGWAWLATALRQRPWSADIQIRVMEPDGDWIKLHVDTDDDTSPGWLRLNATTSARVFEPGNFDGERWLRLVRWQAERVNPGYGQIGVFHGPGGETTLENCLPVNFGRNRPQYTVGESREWLRGYAWVTILAQELADRLGGVAALRGTGVFREVAQLDKGGVWLQATEYFGQYDLVKAAQVFEVLAPVLRPGLPELPYLPRYGPYLLVYEDASNRRR
jgi:hypothetical protein